MQTKAENKINYPGVCLSAVAAENHMLEIRRKHTLRDKERLFVKVIYVDISKGYINLYLCSESGSGAKRGHWEMFLTANSEDVSMLTTCYHLVF